MHWSRTHSSHSAPEPAGSGAALPAETASGASSVVMLGTLAELREVGFLLYEGAGLEIAVREIDGRLFAYDNRCPHMGAAMQRAKIVEDCILCPWHHARFELGTGRSVDMMEADIAAYPVEVRDGVVQLHLVPIEHRADAGPTS
jgi:nitrite reductase/ring-hydroxylating ferredoxin subunit